MKVFLSILAGLAAAPVSAQEIVTLPTRPGVTQSFFIANMGGRTKFGDRNFLPRSRREFIRNGVLPVILDAPSDHAVEMSDEFRTSAAHTQDARAVLAELKKRYPGLPLFLVGTSRGTLCAAHLGRALGDEVAGVVLSASLFYSGGGMRARPLLAGFNWPAIKPPLLFVHHEDDGCGATPYREAARLGQSFPPITVKGGKPPESGPCDPLAAHGFFGREAETVDAIAAWMLKKPFAREIR